MTVPAGIPDAGAGDRLQPIPGPSPLGGGLKRFLDLLWVIALADFKKSYFGTVLGYVWSLARPLALFAILLVVFTQVFRLGSEVPFYPVLLLMNIVLFGFIQESTMAAVTSLVSQEPVVRKTQFPRLVVPLATVLTGLMNLMLNFVVVIVFALAFGVGVSLGWILIPVLIGALVAVAVPLAMLLSSLYPKFRDLSIIWSVVVTALFYATPVLYPIEVVPEGLRSIIMLSPLSVIFVEARKWVIDPGAMGAAEAAGGYAGLLPAAAIFVGLIVAAFVVFWREAPGVAEEL